MGRIGIYGPIIRGAAKELKHPSRIGYNGVWYDLDKDMEAFQKAWNSRRHWFRRFLNWLRP